MTSLNRQRLMVKVARLYYDQDLTQGQIADRLRISRQKVQRLLTEAREESVVQITIKPVVGVFPDVEKALEEKYGLADSVVVETSAHDDQQTLAREVGAGAAEYLLRVVRPRDRIVISWGNALRAMVNSLSYSERLDARGVEVIQGLGGLGDPNHEIHATQLVMRTATALFAQAILLPAPAVAGSHAVRAAFHSDPYVRDVLDKARSADLAFVGIGSASSAESTMVPEFWNIMNAATLADLKQHGAVGSINLRYFDEHGNTVSSEFDRVVIGLTLEELKKIYRVVGIAGGLAKLEAIVAALKGRLINVLVTDHLTAVKLLEADRQVRSLSHSSLAQSGTG